MFWWVFDLFFCIKGAIASGDQKWTWAVLKLLYKRESSLVLSVPRGVGWRGGEGDSRGRRCQSSSVVFDSLWPHGLHGPWNSPGQNTGVGSLSLLQGIFPTQGPNTGLPHCRQIPYQLSHKRNCEKIYICMCVYIYIHIYIYIIMTDSCCCMAETNTTLSIKNLIKIIMKKIAPLVFSSICPVVIFQASWVAYPILISFYLLWHYTFLKTVSFMTCFLPKA